MRVFISHSSENAGYAKTLCDKLEAGGFSCFLAPRDIRAGNVYAEEIINGIDNCDLIVLLLSKASNESPHVLREIERAVSKKKPVIVYKLEEVEISKSLEYFLMSHQWINEKPGKNLDEIAAKVADFAAQKGEASYNDDGVKRYVDTHDKRKRVTVLIAFFAAALIAIGAVVLISINGGKDSSQNSESSSLSSSDSTESSSLSSTESSSSSSEASASSESAPAANPAEQDKPAAVKLGERITLGTYNGEPIEWRVINVSEDKTKAVVISDKILTMKAFDAAEGGKFNEHNGEDFWRKKTADVDEETQRLIRGDNRWETSNIRTWLNSAKENVSYSDQAPTSPAMSEKRNGYSTEAGFLNAFTEEELEKIAVTDVNTNGSITEDKVFLLSLDELKWLSDADVSVHAKPTEASLEQDKSLWFSVNKSAYETDDHFWWLREANADNVCEVWCVNISYYENEPTISQYAGLEGYGVRPAMTIDLTKIG